MKYFHLSLILFIFYFIALASAITINGDTIYSSIDNNITQEFGYAHINISNILPYNNLVFYMPFDVNQSSNNTQYDLSLYKNHGIVTGALWNDSYSSYGNSYSFDGLNDHIAIGNVSSLDISNISISVWIYPKELATSDRIIAGSLTFVNKYNIGVDTASGSGKIAANVNGTTSIRTTNNNFTINNWQHLVVVNNGTNSLMYRNGVLLETTYIGVFLNSGNGVWIGERQDGLGDYNGLMDEVMIFNSSLTNTQVLDIYNNQSRRFNNNGSMLFQDINLGTNDTLNLWIFSYQNTLSSSIFAKISNGNQSVSSLLTKNSSGSGVANNINLSSLSNRSNLNLTLLFYSNGSNYLLNEDFYSPIAIGNITLEGYMTQEEIEDITPSNIFLITPNNGDNAFIRLEKINLDKDLPIIILGRNI